MNVILECEKALAELNWTEVDRTVEVLREARQVFCIGNGGGYAHAAHFAADLRKIARKHAHSFDSVGELTARVNDDGWERAWYDWMLDLGYRNRSDVIFLFSVGGGMDGLSKNLPATSWGIVGARGVWGNRIVIPSESTPVVEGCQSVVAHHLVEQLCD